MSSIADIERFANGTHCPSWCEGKDCTRDLQTGETTHDTIVTTRGVMLGAIEQYASPGVPRQQPIVTLWARGDVGLEELTVQECRDAAAVLVAAADRLEEILGGAV